MIRGRTVTVLRPTETGRDRFNEPTVSNVPETVDNVLIEPGDTTGLEASRPDGANVDLTLHFPKGYEGDLRGCYVALPSPWPDTVKVVGEPQRFMVENTPTPWNMAVAVEVTHG